MVSTTEESGFDSRKRVQTDFGLKSAFYKMGTGILLPEVQQPGRKVTSHLNLVTKLRMRGVIPPLFHISSGGWCIIKYRDNYTFSITRLSYLEEHSLLEISSPSVTAKLQSEAICLCN
jgi:hypothetical protein